MLRWVRIGFSTALLTLCLPAAVGLAMPPLDAVCLAEPPADGVYALSTPAVACPKKKGKEGFGRWREWLCFPEGHRVAVVAGCVGLAAGDTSWRRPRVDGTGSGTFIRSWSDGKRCHSGWAERYRRTASGGLAVVREAFSTCGGGGREAREEIELTYLGPVDSTFPVDADSLAASTDEALSMAAIEARASKKELSGRDCTLLRGVLDLAAAEPGNERLSSLALRILLLGVDPCLVTGVVRTAAHPALSYHAVPALSRLVPDASVRVLTLLRIVADGHEGTRSAASAIARSVPESHRSLLNDGLLKLLRKKRLSPTARITAAAVLAESEGPELFARTMMETATRLEACAERAAFLDYASTWFVAPVLRVSPEEAVRRFRPLLLGGKCPAARTAALRLFAERMHYGEPGEPAWALLGAVIAADPEGSAATLLGKRPFDRDCYDGRGEPPAPSRVGVLETLHLAVCE